MPVDLGSFKKTYRHSRSLGTRLIWMVISRVFFLTHFPWPSSLKSALLRFFGASVGRGLVIKPNVNIKYPWNLEIGDHTWIGEAVWIDSLGRIKLGNNVCLSQGAILETGNHDWSDPTFSLILEDVVVEDGAWAAVRSVILPGSKLANHCVLGAGAVLSGTTEPFGIYVGNPAVKISDRTV